MLLNKRFFPVTIYWKRLSFNRFLFYQFCATLYKPSFYFVFTICLPFAVVYPCRLMFIKFCVSIMQDTLPLSILYQSQGFMYPFVQVILNAYLKMTNHVALYTSTFYYSKHVDEKSYICNTKSNQYSTEKGNVSCVTSKNFSTPQWMYGCFKDRKCILLKLKNCVSLIDW